MTLIGYAPPRERNGIRERLKQVGCTVVIVEVSPSPLQHGLDRALATVSRGDTLVVSSVADIAFGAKLLLRLVSRLEHRGANLWILEPTLDTRSEEGTAYVELLRQSLRTTAETSPTSSNGRKRGPHFKLTVHDVDHARRRLGSGETMTVIADDLRVSRTTLRRYLQRVTP